MHFDLSVPTELIMNVLDYNCAKMQQVKALRENVDFYIICNYAIYSLFISKANSFSNMIQNYTYDFSVDF